MTARARSRTSSRADHYSYAVYADPAMAERFDALRFSGPVGRLLADTQEAVLASFLEPLTGRTILDVGTGTGRAAIALARRGATVTAVDASPQMLAVARRRADEAQTAVKFLRGDVQHLEFPDGAFDAVVCLRVLMHTPEWRRAVAELCRVARVQVVLDYPALASAAALQSMARRLADALGGTVEAYRVFSDRSIRTALATHGFRILDVHRQFVLPIALHKSLASVALTDRIERLLARAGLRDLLGSPVTLVAERCAS